MHKIWLIIQREYLVRVRKKSFILMTILGPLLMTGLIIAPALLAKENQEKRMIAIHEKNTEISSELEDTEFINFTLIPTIESVDLKQNFSDSPFYALLEIKDSTYTLYSDQQVTLNVRSTLENQINNILEKKALKEAGIDISIIESTSNSIKIKTKIVSKDGKTTTTNTEVSMGIGFISGLLIYMFIFMYGTMVMRGVIEEKTNRIVEVIISSVKPFQLMMGKIIGVALVGLTQFTLWISLTLIISTIAEATLLDINQLSANISANEKSIVLKELTAMFGGVDILQILSAFLVYFMGGYLLYSSLFAAVGSAVDSEADTQQFILPVTIPLILAFVLIQPIMENPDGNLAFWMSIIPFTSPVIMMVRIPFGVPTWELTFSLITLLSGFIASTWVAGKIYRTGILMYGKKATYKELLKWLRYKG